MLVTSIGFESSAREFSSSMPELKCTDQAAVTTGNNCDDNNNDVGEDYPKTSGQSHCSLGAKLAVGPTNMSKSNNLDGDRHNGHLGKVSGRDLKVSAADDDDHSSGSELLANTMETDDSFGMNQQSNRINSIEVEENLNCSKLAAHCARAEPPANSNVHSAAFAAAGPNQGATAGSAATGRRQQQQQQLALSNHSKGMSNLSRNCGSSSKRLGQNGPHLLIRGLLRRQARCINSMLAIKLRTLFLLLNMLYLFIGPQLMLVHAGFWTFYLPNFMKPSGYSELSDLIHKIEADLNETMDNFSDTQYFWGLLQKAGATDSIESADTYPEESVCADVFPLFRDLAIEYTYIDYEHFISPIKAFHEHLKERRDEWYPDGPKSKNILPRQWEQTLYESDLSLKIFWQDKLTKNPEYQKKREQMVNIWKGVKRSLDSSLPCIYLRYAYRQMAEDINQLALDNNLKSMHDAMEMVKSAYKRIDKFSASDDKAKDAISETIKKEDRMNIKS